MTRRALPQDLPELGLDIKTKREAERLYKGLDTRGQKKKQVLNFQHDVKELVLTPSLSISDFLSLSEINTHITHIHTLSQIYFCFTEQTRYTHIMSLLTETTHWCRNPYSD